MNLYFRLILLLLSGMEKAKITDILAPTSLRFRVLPNDLDLNFHMNNGRYLTIMDLGRLDLILRSGLLRAMLKDKSIPVLSAAQIRYRLPLYTWEPYVLETRVVCWDDKWIYLEQKFILVSGKKAGSTAAIALLKGAFLNKKSKETVPTGNLLQKIGIDGHSPPFPEHITDWIAADNTTREYIRQNHAS